MDKVNVRSGRRKIIAAAVLLAVFILLSVIGIKVIGPMASKEPKSLQPLPDPQETVTAFFNSLVSNDFDASGNYISNYSALGFTPFDEEDKVSEILARELVESYSFELCGECETKSMSAVQKVDFTFFAMEGIIEELREYAAVTAYDESYKGSQIDEAAANEILYESLVLIMEDAEKYYVTRTFEIELEYDGEQWKIIVPENLLDAIVGVDG